MGPITVFDKSFLQSLTVDESVFFDHFFNPVTSPLFFIETLADLEKAVRQGRTPEREVTLRDQIDESVHSDRLIAALCTTFSILALLLTCVGLYGALAFNVARRTGEIGIRMALGAHPRDILQSVLGQGMRLTVTGLVLGIVAALSAGSLLTSILFGVKQTDPLVFLAVSAVLLSAAVLACYLPARRAMHLDPLSALRHE
ncbi:MAG: FtsX-like permease family protein [Candidatus Acidiferrales bacterium]